MTPPQFIAFGEALTDFIRQENDVWQSRPGGAGWNVARVVGGHFGREEPEFSWERTDKVEALRADAGLARRSEEAAFAG
ncbi:hypothetical protein [Chromobacterium phragmitis]|uniref:Carbohydrate kinase PfkB domain-containing protein n=1 Tax=Chromobacterium phragmitis TaxID=2202141 RepID=A0ABV0IRW2_9NEIS